MTKQLSTLFINGLELDVCLGWLEPEQQQRQIVLLDVEIAFPKPPAACQSDHLRDTFCYATLAEKIRDLLADEVFHLIEHLTFRIYQFIKTQLPDNIKIIVSITKHPQIKGLTNGVCFRYGDA